MFIKIVNGFPVDHPVTLENMRYLFPDFDFNRIMTPQIVQPLGYGIYEFTRAPKADIYKKLVEGNPVLNQNGIYYQNWLMVDMTDVEKAEWNRSLARNVRNERDRLLAKSDWTQLPDADLTIEQKIAYKLYRQELRDITNRPSFPLNVVRHATLEEFKQQLIYPLGYITEQAKIEFEQREYAAYLNNEPNVLDVNYPNL